jgi:hypothetical protein
VKEPVKPQKPITPIQSTAMSKESTFKMINQINPDNITETTLKFKRSPIDPYYIDIEYMNKTFNLRFPNMKYLGKCRTKKDDKDKSTGAKIMSFKFELIDSSENIIHFKRIVDKIIDITCIYFEQHSMEYYKQQFTKEQFRSLFNDLIDDQNRIKFRFMDEEVKDRRTKHIRQQLEFIIKKDKNVIKSLNTTNFSNRIKVGSRMSIDFYIDQIRLSDKFTFILSPIVMKLYDEPMIETPKINPNLSMKKIETKHDDELEEKDDEKKSDEKSDDEIEKEDENEKEKPKKKKDDEKEKPKKKKDDEKEKPKKKIDEKKTVTKKKDEKKTVTKKKVDEKEKPKKKIDEKKTVTKKKIDEKEKQKKKIDEKKTISKEKKSVPKKEEVEDKKDDESPVNEEKTESVDKEDEEKPETTEKEDTQVAEKKNIEEPKPEHKPVDMQTEVTNVDDFGEFGGF